MKLLTVLFTLFILTSIVNNKIPFKIYRDNENCGHIVRVDTATLKLDTLDLR